MVNTEVIIQRFPRCYWHTGCEETRHGGIMRMIRRDTDSDLFECLHCKKDVTVMHGIPFDTPVCATESTTSLKEQSCVSTMLEF